MNTRADIHRELFGRLAAAERMNPFRPALDVTAVVALSRAAARCAQATEKGSAPGVIRMAAMDSAVAALRVVYSLDDALS